MTAAQLHAVSTPHSHRLPGVVQSDIREVRAELRQLEIAASGMPTAVSLTAKISTLNARLSIESDADRITHFRSELALALAALDAATVRAGKLAGLQRKLADLEVEYTEAVRLEGMAQREAAGRRYAEALNAHRADVLNAGRSYRRLLNAHRASGRTDPLPRFDSSLILPVSYQGTAGEAMRQGTLPFEQDDDHAA